MSPRQRRDLPHNLDAEASLIGAILLSPHALADIAAVGLTPQDFYKATHQFVFAAIAALAAAGEPIDAVTVAQKLRRDGLLDQVGGPTALLDIQSSTPAISNAGRYARIVAEDALRRRAIVLAADLSAAAMNGHEPRELVRFVRDGAAALATWAAGSDDGLASWEPKDLGPAWRGEKVRPVAVVFPRDDGLALLPPGLNYMFGDSGDGKSLLATIAALTELRDGHAVIWVTYEDADEALIVARLRLLGATWEDVALLRFITPETGLADGTPALAELVSTTDARLAVLDSVGEAMAVGGVNEDRDNEVGPWFRQTLRLIHNLSPSLAICPIDHSTKAKDNPLFPSGSKRKRAAPTGRSYLLNVRQSFAVGAVGYVQLVVAKDREGRFRRGDIAAEIMLDASTTPYRWTVTAPREGDSYSPRVRRRTAVERVLEVLGESAVAMTAEDVARIANGPDRTQPGEARLALRTTKNVLGTLSEVQKITAPNVAGRRQPALWRLHNPERDDGDGL